MNQPLRGVLPVVHTPFTEEDNIDWECLEAQVAWALTQGAHGYCTGMVSELLRLSDEERRELTRRLAGHERQGRPFIASIGAESCRQAISNAQFAADVGCDALMAVPPLTSSLPESALFEYFSGIAASTSLPMIVQDASGYVGQAIPLNVYLMLLDRFGPERILFKPEASPVGETISVLRDKTLGQARVLDGSGGCLLIDSYRRGIVGTIPGMEFLEGILAIWEALEQGDEAAAYRVYFSLCALVTLQLQAGLDGFLAIEKYVLHRRGLFRNERRRHPNAWRLDSESREEVDRLLDMLRTATPNHPTA